MRLPPPSSGMALTACRSIQCRRRRKRPVTTEPCFSSARAIDPSPEAKACRAAFERLLGAAADLGARAGNLRRLAREYRRTERRAKALENVLLPEVEEAIKRVDEQLDTMDREEVTRTRWAGKVRMGETLPNPE
jgi:vacuolar-type H+-ATPase subunit D/Vma8